MILTIPNACAWPFYSLIQIFGDYMTSFVQTASEETGPGYSSPMIVSQYTSSAWTWALFQLDGIQPTLADVTRYVLYIIFITLHVDNICVSIVAVGLRYIFF